MRRPLIQKLDEIPAREVIFGTIPVLSNKIQVVADKSMEKITLKQWLLIIMIMQFEGGAPTLSEVASAMGSSRQNVKQLALKLEQKGLLKIEKDQNDSRIVKLSVLPECMTMFEKQAEYERHFLELMYKDMNEEELEIIARGMKKLVQNVIAIEDLLAEGKRI